ncbi:CPC1_2 [Blepharisma stoltei]|uniref:Calponin-homology (CH) domain-containing protein n=1 Tax=Blepharisma stoltei TaxID=1481888 RepID=A0AAU9K072_9CILI|nr:unnamed protein product [Blepharisma stoltei]
MENWLADLGFSISNYEEDFSNGYLLGQILYRYDRQEDFGQFINKPKFASSNLAKVQLSFERLRLKFDPQRLINKEFGYSKKVLSNLFKALHTLDPRALLAAKPKSAVSIKLISKTERMAQRLQKFEEERIKQSKQAYEDHQKTEEVIKKLQGEARKAHLDAIKENKLFMQQWEEEGKKEWKKNQSNLASRKQKEFELKTKLAQDFKTTQVKYIDGNALDAENSIDEFERNMTRLGIDHVSDEPERKKQKQNLQTEAAVTMAKIKENKSKNVQAAKEKEIRQRKIHVEQLRTKKIDIYRNHIKAIVEGLAKPIYNILGFGIKKVKKFSKFIKDTQEAEKNIKEIMEKSMQKWGPIEAQRQLEIEEMNAKILKELPEKKLEIKRKIIEGMKASREKHQKECGPVMNLILDLAEESANYLKENPKIPEKIWNGWMEKFKEGLPPWAEESNSLIDQANISEVAEETDEFGEPKTSVQIEKKELNDYLNAEGIWEAENVPNDEYLGDIIEVVMDAAYPPDPLPPFPPGPHYLPYKICIIGPPFSGKKTQSKKLQELFGLKIFEMQKIIDDAAKVVQRKSEPEDPKRRKLAEEEPEIFIQAALENSTETANGRSKLLRGRLRGVFGDEPKLEEEVKKPGKKEEVKCQGFAILSYPSSAEEAIDIEKELGGFIHPSELPESVSSIKKREAQIIAFPSPKEYPPPKPFRTVFDLVIWLDVEKNTLIRRCVDRRVDNSGNVYNLTYRPPPDNILNKCKPIDKPTEEELKKEIQDFNERKEELYRCFSEFGDRWETLLFFDADQPIEAVTEIIKKRLADISVIKSQPINKEEDSTIVFNGQTLLLSNDSAKLIADKWETMKFQYLKEIGFSLKLVDMHWERYLTHLQEMGNEFREFLERNDDKENIVKNFLNGLNGIVVTKTVFSSSELSQTYAEIGELIDLLWDITDQRKIDAISHREEIMNESPLNKELTGIIKLARQLLQVEINKYYSILNLIHLFKALTTETEFSEYSTPILKINWNLEVQAGESFPALNLLIETAKKSIVSDLAEIERNNEIFIFRCRLIEKWATNSIQKYTEKIEEAYADLDNWITESVSLENDVINEIASKLKNVLDTRNPCEDLKIPTNQEINSHFKLNF